MNRIFDVKNFLSDKKAMPILLLCLCIGITITLISKKQTVTRTTKEKVVVESCDNKSESIELKLKKTLSKVAGVGDVEVMIIYASSDEKILAKDVDSQGNEKTVNYDILYIDHSK